MPGAKGVAKRGLHTSLLFLCQQRGANGKPRASKSHWGPPPTLKFEQRCTWVKERWEECGRGPTNHTAPTANENKGQLFRPNALFCLPWLFLPSPAERALWAPFFSPPFFAAWGAFGACPPANRLIAGYPRSNDDPFGLLFSFIALVRDWAGSRSKTNRKKPPAVATTV
jgi:hypothetical protein